MGWYIQLSRFACAWPCIGNGRRPPQRRLEHQRIKHSASSTQGWHVLQLLVMCTGSGLGCSCWWCVLARGWAAGASASHKLKPCLGAASSQAACGVGAQLAPHNSGAHHHLVSSAGNDFSMRQFNFMALVAADHPSCIDCPICGCHKQSHSLLCLLHHRHTPCAEVNCCCQAGCA